MRQNKGTYNAAAFNSPSMINNGMLLADFDYNGTSREARGSYEEYKDDIDHLLEEDLTFYDEGADTAAGDVQVKQAPVLTTAAPVTVPGVEEEEDAGEENGAETEEYEEEDEEEEVTTTTEATTTTTTPEEVTTEVEEEEEEEDVK
uniref:Acidic leucine-rich nuclear phosphoprotein 32-related protein n=1 Tax=Caenorhabditis tropicalis TaxID=1561998 RepID=A0A1I7T6T6_9PELO